jgi:hypothetical protein
MDTNVQALTAHSQAFSDAFKNLFDKADELYNKAKEAVEAKEKAARDSAAAAAAAAAASGFGPASGPSPTVPHTSPVLRPPSPLPSPTVPHTSPVLRPISPLPSSSRPASPVLRPPSPLPLIPGPPPPPPPPPHPLVPAPVVRPAAPPRAYGKRVYPIHNGVLTYYVLRVNGPMPRTRLLQNRIIQDQYFTFFNLPPDTHNVKIDVKESRLARYQIAPITLEAEVTFTLWERSTTSYDVFYCGMYEPGPTADVNIQMLKSPPELS